jgi:hypothetical protein
MGDFLDNFRVEFSLNPNGTLDLTIFALVIKGIPLHIFKNYSRDREKIRSILDNVKRLVFNLPVSRLE